MPTPYIGPWPFVTWDGSLEEASRRFAIVRRANVNGVGVAFDAWEASPQEITTLTVYEASETPPDLRSMTSTDVDVIDPLGVRWPCTVAQVRQSPPVLTCDGQQVRRVVFVLVPASTPPADSSVGAAI